MVLINVTRSQMIVTFIVFSNGIVSSFHKFQLSAIREIIVDYYDISDVTVYYTSLIFPLAFLLLAFPNKNLLRKLSLRALVTLVALLNLFGALLKSFFLKTHHYNGVLLAQILPAFGYLMFYYSIPTLVKEWFTGKYVIPVVSFCYSSLYFGSMLAYLQPVILHVKHRDDDDTLLHLVLMSVIVAAVSTGVFVFTLLFIKSAPKDDSKENRANAMVGDEGAYDLSKGKNRVLISLSTGLSTATALTYLTVLNQMILPVFHYKPSFVSLTGFLLTSGGIAGLFVAVTLMNNFKRLYLAVIATVTSWITLFCISTVIEYNLQHYILIMSPVLGFCLLGFQTLSTLMSLEILHSWHINNSLTFFTSIAFVLEMALVPMVTQVLHRSGPKKAHFILGFTLLISLLTLISLKRRKTPQTYQRQIDDEDIICNFSRSSPESVEFEIISANMEDGDIGLVDDENEDTSTANENERQT